MKNLNKENFLIWLKAAAIRAVKTIAQSALAMIPVAVSIIEVDWMTVIGTAALSGVISLLMSVHGLPEVSSNVDKNSEESS